MPHCSWTGASSALDAVIAVAAPEEAQLERLGRSRGWTPEARLRLAVQRDDAAFAAAADVVLDRYTRCAGRGARDAVTALRRRAGRT